MELHFESSNEGSSKLSAGVNRRRSSYQDLRTSGCQRTSWPAASPEYTSILRAPSNWPGVKLSRRNSPCVGAPLIEVSDSSAFDLPVVHAVHCLPSSEISRATSTAPGFAQ